MEYETYFAKDMEIILGHGTKHKGVLGTNRVSSAKSVLTLLEFRLWCNLTFYDVEATNHIPSIG